LSESGEAGDQKQYAGQQSRWDQGFADLSQHQNVTGSRGVPDVPRFLSTMTEIRTLAFGVQKSHKEQEDSKEWFVMKAKVQLKGWERPLDKGQMCLIAQISWTLSSCIAGWDPGWAVCLGKRWVYSVWEKKVIYKTIWVIRG
jgi:hypothetical protein